MKGEVVRVLAGYRAALRPANLGYGERRTPADWAQVALSAAEATGIAYAHCRTPADYRRVQAHYFALVKRYGRHSSCGHCCEHSTHS